MALSTAQAAALTAAQTAAFSTDQIRALENADLAAFKTSQIAALSVDQIKSGLSTDQIAAFGSAQIAAFTTNQVQNGLSTDQIAALNTRQAMSLTTAQVAALSSDQVKALEVADLAVLTSAQIAAFTTAQVQNGFTTEQIVALTSVQVASLTTAQVVALSTAQVAALETGDLAAMTTKQIQAFTTDQIQNGMGTDQIAALTMKQVDALTAAQIGALTTDQIQHLQFGSPIVLDLNGDGVHTRNVSEGVQFDLYATGQATQTGWVDSTDGLLAYDRDGNGTIDSGAELFGTSTVLANGQTASDGYVALKELDANGDGVIDAKDAAYDKLSVWVDANGDGVSQSGELHSLASLDIASVNVDATKTSVKDAGNWIGAASSYTRTDGTTAATGDVWFTAQKPAAVSATPAAPAADTLRGKVGGLVQAMASFNATGSASADSASKPGLADLSGSAVKTGMQASIGVMVDVMKQFDANGNKLGNAGAPLASTAESLARSVAQPTAAGFLTSGGGTR